MKKLLAKIYSMKLSKDKKHRIHSFLGLKICLRIPKVKSYQEKYKKQLDKAYLLLQDAASKKVFAARVAYLESMDINANPIPHADYPEYQHPEVPINQGDVLIDGGVSQDITITAEFAQAVGDAGCVISFEPEPVGYERAKAKIEEAGLHNVNIFPCGLWNKKDVLEICQNDGASTVCLHYTGTKLVQCDLVALDEFAKAEVISKIDFIKLDIERAEPEALRGSKKIIKKNKPNLAVCVYHKPEHLFEIILYLNSLNLGYKFWLGHHRVGPYSTVLYAKSLFRD